MKKTWISILSSAVAVLAGIAIGFGISALPEFQAIELMEKLRIFLTWIIIAASVATVIFNGIRMIAQWERTREQLRSVSLIFIVVALYSAFWLCVINYFLA